MKNIYSVLLALSSGIGVAYCQQPQPALTVAGNMIAYTIRDSLIIKDLTDGRPLFSVPLSPKTRPHLQLGLR